MGRNERSAPSINEGAMDVFREDNNIDLEIEVAIEKEAFDKDFRTIGIVDIADFPGNYADFVSASSEEPFESSDDYLEYEPVPFPFSFNP